MLKEGKINKEKADEKITRINSKINEIQEFNKLTPEQKKDRLINNFKASIENRVKEGKLERKQADELLKKFLKKIGSWDGNGYPDFHLRHSGHKCKKVDSH